MTLLAYNTDCSFAASARETPVAHEPSYDALPGFTTPAQAASLERKHEMRARVGAALTDASAAGHTISSSILESVTRLVQLLPDALPVTDPYVTPIGSLCFDWDDDSECQLSILLQATGRVGYAAYFSGEKVNGSADFSRIALPASLVGAVERWVEESRRRRPG